MFCRNCGHEVLPGDRFCGSCGTEVVTAQGMQPRKVSNQKSPAAEGSAAGTEHTYREPLKDKKQSYTQDRPLEGKAELKQPETRAPLFSPDYRKYVGIIAALVAFLGLFLPNIVINDFGLSSYIGVSQPSYSYFSIMAESGVQPMSVLAVGSILLVVLLQAANIPLVSLIGCAGMLFSVYMITIAVDGSNGGADYGIGFWLFLIASFVCVFAAFFARRPKENRR